MFIGAKKIQILKRPPTTWNPSDASSNLPVSNTGLTVTCTAVGTHSSLRCVAAAIKGRKFWEITATVFSSSQCVFGCGNTTASLTTFTGASSASFGHHDGGTAFGGVTGTIATFTQGDILSFAFNIDALRYWVRVNGGNWNNSASAFPETSVGGLAVTTTGPYLPMFNLFSNTNVVTANFGRQPFSYPKPVGFGIWS